MFIELENIDTLHLGSNVISTVDENAFAGLSNLRNLILSSNKISKLSSLTFGNQVNLVTLDLSYNSISSLNQTGLFAYLRKLTYLGLRYNNMKYVSPTAFSGLNNLQNLALSFNQISCLDKSTFDGLGSLNGLRLQNNSLTTFDFKKLVSLPSSFNYLNVCNNPGNFPFCDNWANLKALFINNSSAVPAPPASCPTVL
jgi:Leucine-rich repeat (LRR) protein